MSEPFEEHPEHPVRLTVEDDLRRNRVTVFLRVILAVPHVIWVVLWSIVMAVVAVASWVATLVAGRLPDPLHRFATAYIRYVTHVGAYVFLIANPYPGFSGEEGDYPIDVRLPPPEPQERWKTFLRLPLAIPALLLASALGGAGALRFYGGRGGRFRGGGGGALLAVTGLLGWFASLGRGAMPKGLRDAGAYSLGYTAQVYAYLFLVTERYPNADPAAMLADVARPPVHPVRLVGDAHQLRRSRLTAFFRPLLAIPHLVWLALWTIAAILAAIANWVVTLGSRTPSPTLHRFLCAYVRYSLHVNAYLYLAANPFPRFDGEGGRYPLDLELPPPEPQNRWVTGFRVLLGIPALAVSWALGWGLIVAAVLTWFAALATGRAPWGLRNYSAYALRYGAQCNAYLYLLTERYPNASPLEGEELELAERQEYVAAVA